MLSQTIGTGSRYLGWVITRESGKIPSDETEKINKINDDAAYTYLAVQPRIEGRASHAFPQWHVIVAPAGF